MKPLAESVAVAKGAELLGEAIVFVVGAGVIYLEMSRQSAKSTKEKAEKANRSHKKEVVRGLVAQLCRRRFVLPSQLHAHACPAVTARAI